MQLPTRNPITLPFGATTDPYTPSNPHKGTDFSYAGVDGKNIYAVEDCTLIYRPLNGNDGNALYATVGDHMWGYLHLDHPVATGAVKQGQLIGIMGDTGAAEGVHLHLALKVNGNFVDPYAYITKGDDMSTVGEVEFNHLFTGFFGPITDANPVKDDDRKAWIGAETNTVIRAMFADPRQAAYAAKAAGGGGGKEYVKYIPPEMYIEKI